MIASHASAQSGEVGFLDETPASVYRRSSKLTQGLIMQYSSQDLQPIVAFTSVVKQLHGISNILIQMILLLAFRYITHLILNSS
jgi:hypothetical protein